MADAFCICWTLQNTLKVLHEASGQHFGGKTAEDCGGPDAFSRPGKRTWARRGLREDYGKTVGGGPVLVP